MKIWFDTEFIEDGRTIELISIGMVAEDRRTLYLENADCDLDRANDWVKEQVIPHLAGGTRSIHPSKIAQAVRDFASPGSPEFWAYYGAYDWVVLCQLFGTMMQLPATWPMYCRDVKQLCDSLGNPQLPKQSSTEHHALADALWTKQAWEFLQKEKAIG